MLDTCEGLPHLGLKAFGRAFSFGRIGDIDGLGEVEVILLRSFSEDLQKD